jgi:thiamine-monophosphate kinase
MKFESARSRGVRAATVRDLGEFGLIRQLCKDLPRAGDDCAVLPGNLLLTCDPVVEGIHYLPGTPARQVGWKAMARNLSDIAAMGGTPRWAVVSLGLRPNTPVRWVTGLYAGMNAVAGQFGCEIVGGDITHVRREPFVVVTMLGHAPKPVLRTGSKIGDSVFVTGTLGAGRHLTFVPRVREAQWLVRHFDIHAMIDLSDGLASDVRHLLRPGIRFDLDSAEIPGKLPAALTRGEDFELLFTIDPRDVTALRAKWNFPLKLTEIGRVVRGHGVRLDGRPLSAKGYDHFPKRR